MVRDGIYYALACILAAVLIAWLAVWPLAVIPLLLAAFFLWFFRDPEREIPSTPGGIVSPGDGKVTDVSVVQIEGRPRTRISVFLNVFNVHVNRSPIAGVISRIEYRKGKFGNAMGAISAELNEQNFCTVRGDDGEEVTFKQIAGLIARRIVFTKREGDKLQRGERVGLIKFGSRVDVVFSPDAHVAVKIGDHVKGGSTILATLPTSTENAVLTGAQRQRSQS